MSKRARYSVDGEDDVDSSEYSHSLLSSKRAKLKENAIPSHGTLEGLLFPSNLYVDELSERFRCLDSGLTLSLVVCNRVGLKNQNYLKMLPVIRDGGRVLKEDMRIMNCKALEETKRGRILARKEQWKA